MEGWALRARSREPIPASPMAAPSSASLRRRSLASPNRRWSRGPWTRCWECQATSRWFDRSGKQIGSIGEPDNSGFGQGSVSPDGSAVALPRSVNGNVDIWLMDTARGVLRRLTSDPAREREPIWSPNGTASRSLRKGLGDIYQTLASGAAPEELLLESPINKNLDDWSPDGRFIVYSVQDPQTRRDLWALPLPDVRSGDRASERNRRRGRAGGAFHHAAGR
jgi:dipeptidyl aminopeptidase/acylaminoacyl peptidase